MAHRLMIFAVVLCSLALCSHQPPAVHNHLEEPGHRGCSSYYDSILQETIHTSVQNEPQFIGGTRSWQKFLNKNFRYPLDMNENGEVQYSVRTTCIIDKEGKLLSIRINNVTDTAHYSSLDREFIRMVKQVPRWKPAVCNGQQVTCETSSIMTGCIYYEYEY